jgi:flavin reductase (DIM6/NTAB) family NADH-FMN oxidoreductase RutF
MTLRHRLSNYRGIPEYAVVGLKEPQELIRVELHGLGDPQDVTFRHTMVAMRPFTISIGSGGEQNPDQIRRARLWLEFIDNQEKQRIIGRIALNFVQTIDLPRGRLNLFSASGHWNGCLPWAALRLYYLRRAYLNRKSRNPFNFQMSFGDLHSLYVFYICPRPVVLVSVSDRDRNNIFPMDLIGAAGEDYFLMALRTTSPAVELIEHSGRMVLSSIPAGCKAIAYELGKHHRKESIDLAALPFETTKSPAYGLPMPSTALAVREVHVEETHIVGSHMLFVTNTVHQESRSDTPRMFHIHGTYHQYLHLRGRLPQHKH